MFPTPRLLNWQDVVRNISVYNDDNIFFILLLDLLDFLLTAVVSCVVVHACCHLFPGCKYISNINFKSSLRQLAICVIDQKIKISNF